MLCNVTARNIEEIKTKAVNISRYKRLALEVSDVGRFNRVLERLNSLGGGTLLINESLCGCAFYVPYDNISIVGSGFQTEIKSTGVVNDHTVTLVGNNCSISNLKINGGGDIMVAPSAGDGAQCLTVNAENVVIQNVMFVNAYNKQVVITGKHIKIENCIFDSQLSLDKNQDGIHIYGGNTTCEDITIRRCIFKNHVRAGVYTDIDVIDVTIEDNYFDNRGSLYYGAVAIHTQGYGDGIIIKNNKIYSYKNNVRIRAGTKNVTIENNKCYGTYNAAFVIEAEYSTYNLISTEQRFFDIEQITATEGLEYKQVGNEIKIKNNQVSFGCYNGNLIETTTSGLVFISGFNTDNERSIYQKIVIEGNTVISAELDVNQLIMQYLGDNDRIGDLIIKNNNILKGIKWISTHAQNGKGADRIIFEDNVLACLRDASPLNAQEQLYFNRNKFLKYRSGLSASVIFSGTSKTVHVHDNFVDLKDSNMSYFMIADTQQDNPNAEYFISRNKNSLGEYIGIYEGLGHPIPLLDTVGNSGGQYNLFVDNVGVLRIKKGVPKTFTDGVVVGSQSI